MTATITSYTEWETANFSGALVKLHGSPMLREEDFNRWPISGALVCDVIHRGADCEITLVADTGYGGVKPAPKLSEEAVRAAILRVAERVA